MTYRLGTEIKLPVIRGWQAGKTCYSAMCTVQTLLDLTQGHQGSAASKRVREIAKVLSSNSGSVHLAPFTISMGREARFTSTRSSPQNQLTSGTLAVHEGTRISIIEGLDRLDALRISVEKHPCLAESCISIQVYTDPEGQDFSCIVSDIRRFDRPLARSAQIAIDDRDELSRLTRDTIDAVPAFRDSIELAKTTISNRSRKLFTLSSLYHANSMLLAGNSSSTFTARKKLAIEFWKHVATRLPEWTEIKSGKTSAAEIRATFIHCHAIGIAAIARAGRTLLKLYPTSWKRRLESLSTLDWSRSNTEEWEGTAMIGGRLSKSSSAIALAGDVVKRHLELDVSLDDG